MIEHPRCILGLFLASSLLHNEAALSGTEMGFTGGSCRGFEVSLTVHQRGCV